MVLCVLGVAFGRKSAISVQSYSYPRSTPVVPLQFDHHTLGTLAERESVSALLSPTVLVAEDSGDTRHMLKRALEIRGYRVLEAENGRQALELTRQHKPHLIIVDLNMPILDGLETIKYVRLMKGASEQVPIVAITAFDVYGMEEAASEAGCNEYISKPFDLDYLEKVMKGLGFIL